MKKLYFLSFFVLTFICFSGSLFAQDPALFKDEVDKLISKDFGFSNSDSIVLFTGSSSIRMWTDLQEYFPKYNIVNTGFGGSQMSDLLFYHQELILRHKPYKIFIYEGDNDIAFGKNPAEIIETTDSLIEIIRTYIPDFQIILISAKPSISRWKFKDNYNALNHLYRKYCEEHQDMEYVNIWDVMLDESNSVREDIFLEDGLHMNKKGYDLWAEKIKVFLP